MGYFKLSLALCLFLLLMSPLAAQTAPAGPPSGAEQANRERLKTVFRDRKISFEERPLFAEYGGFGSSLIVRMGKTDIEPVDNAEPRASSPESPEHSVPGAFVLAVPLAGQGDGTGDLPGGELPLRFTAALGFIERVQAADTGDRGFIVAFLGDEGSSLPQSLQKRPHTGLEDLCSILEEPEDSFFMYLDIQDTDKPGSLPASLLVQYGSTEGVTSLGSLKNISGLCAELGIPWSPARAEPLRGRSGDGVSLTGTAPGGPSALGYAHAQGLDAIHVSAEIRGPGGAGSVDAAVLEELLFRYAASLEFGKGRDRHYAVIPLTGNIGLAASQRLIFLPEPLLVLAFLAGGAACMAAALWFAFHRKDFSKRRLVSVCAAVLLVAGIGVSVWFDIRVLPLWALPLFFVITAFIFHKPRSILVCTILAYVSLAGVAGLLYSRRTPPPANVETRIQDQNAPAPGSAPTPYDPESFVVDIKSRVQFETSPESKRLSLDITLQSQETPVRFDLSLIGEAGIGNAPPFIYYAPMPYRSDGENNSVEFFLGEAPPNPLSLEIILSGDFSGLLRAEALYLKEDAEGKAYVERVIREVPITR